VRITAQLIDAINGAHLWADRFDGSLEDVFELQDKVAISVAAVIEPTLRQSEIERARRKRPDSLDAYDLYLRALPDAFAAMPEDADKALALLGKAIELEPDFAAAHAIIAFCHEQRYLRGGMQEETRNAALHHARQAIAAGGDDAAALATAGFVIAVCGRDYETALTAFDRSFALSSSSALALGFSSIVRAWKGDDAIAVEQANRALRLSPVDPWIQLPYTWPTHILPPAASKKRSLPQAWRPSRARGSAFPKSCTLPRWAVSTGRKTPIQRCNGLSSWCPASPSPPRSSRRVT
jgi:tetratricopeptide (TPR) repeat protein